MKRAIMSMALAAGLAAMVIHGGGCSDKSGATAGRESESTLDVVKASGVVIIGIGQEAAPFGYRADGELVGFDVAIARAVVARLAEHMGRELTIQFRPVSDETRIAWVQSGEVHMSLCHTNITRKRDANIDFTVPYGWDGKGVMYDLAGGERDLQDFAGATIGIKRSSSSEGEIVAYFQAAGWTPPTLKHFDSHAAGVQALVDGQIAGFTDDNSIIINTAVMAGHRVGPGGSLAVTATPYSPAYFGIGVRENDSDWRDMLNYSLHDLWTSGEFQQIYDEWFGPGSNCPIPLGDRHMEPFVEG